MSVNKKIILLSFLMFGVLSDTWAQCAMCKAQLESNEGDVGNGINTGILYLMIIPYVLLTVMLLVFFKGRLRKSIVKFINN